jgi:hypothetical protein
MMNQLTPSPHPTTGFRFPVIRICAGLCLLLIGLLWGCSSSTEPEVKPDPTPSILFSPAGQGQGMSLSQTMDFSAVAQPAASMTVNWYRGGVLVGQDPVFTYVPAEVGRDTLQVSAFTGAVQDTYYWVINVEEDVTAIPPEVSNVVVEAGPHPADVAVSWIRVSGATFPLVEYMVAFSYDGPITEGNWDQATILGRYPPVPGEVGFFKVFTEQEHDMRPGQEAWFAVRVRDDRQQLSPLMNSVRHDITWPWYLGGLVTDDAGLPIPIVGVTTGDVSGNTDGRGIFLFNEPFRNIDGIRVATSSTGQYNFHTDPVTVQQETTYINITLLNKYELGDPSCWSGEYLEYLRFMTRNVEVPGVPAESQLFTWGEYPVSVYILPGAVNEAGVDLEASCLAAIDFWNITMRNNADLLGIEETDYFVRTTDQEAADIVFLFEHRVQNYGEVSLLLPVGKVLGEVIPLKMQIWINTTVDLDDLLKVQGIALHEFGHALGLFNHSDCSNIGHLMAVAGGAGAMNRPEPIHLDEIRAIRAIRNIPQGANMANFDSGRIFVFD